jgi:hypothetical protein
MPVPISIMPVVKLLNNCIVALRPDKALIIVPLIPTLPLNRISELKLPILTKADDVRFVAKLIVRLINSEIN